MSKDKNPKVLASYGDPKKPKHWPAKKIRQEFAKEILAADRQSPEASFDNIDKLLEWLDE